MYFLEQIKVQFMAQCMNYNIHAEMQGGAETIDTTKPQQAEGPKGPDDVIAHARETNAKLDKNVARETKVAKGLGVAGGEGDEVLKGDSGNDTLGAHLGEGGVLDGVDALSESGEGKKTNEQLLEGLSEKPPFNTLSLEERTEILAQIEEAGLEIPEGMTQEEAFEEAMNSKLTEKQDESISKLGESLDESIMNQLSEKYGEGGKDRLAAVSEIYKELIDNGATIPENIEDFEKMITEEIARRELEELQKEDPEADIDPEVVLQAARSVYSDASANHIRGYNGTGGERGRSFDFPSGNATQDIAQLDNAIQEAPNEQAKKLLMTARRYVGMNETANKQELQSFLGFDPVSTPWCKGFTNACCRDANIPLNSSGSLYSRAGVNDGRRLNLPQEEPQAGDIVIVERAGTVGNGAPAGHICVFLGMSPSGNPIVVGGNQGGRNEGGGGVTITEERRSIVSINRVAESRNS